MVSKDFTLIYTLRKSDIENVILINKYNKKLLYSESFINSKDKLIYCELRDKVRNYKDISNFILKCQVCN
jgi:hypothetical protein